MTTIHTHNSKQNSHKSQFPLILFIPLITFAVIISLIYFSKIRGEQVRIDSQNNSDAVYSDIRETIPSSKNNVSPSEDPFIPVPNL